ncbi:hypothetical protein C8R44DRAFT_782475 [Mycena epipterygia]|nr:hypothetical protein C8R44DRAFT_782475 [Mycena epipterygia]
MLLRQSLRCCPPLMRGLGSPVSIIFPCRIYAIRGFEQQNVKQTRSLYSVPSLDRPVSISPDKVLYRGPLAPTFKRLKVFSLSSLSLSLTMVPLMFAIETNLPLSARACLAAIAIATSGVSTGLIAWAGRSYVTSLRVNKAPENGAVEQLELTTNNLRLQPRITRVFDPLFVVPTKRAFAKWELAQYVLLPPDLRNTTPGQEETVAETTDAQGRVLGRWVVSWGEGGEGNCHEVGTVVRYFNVHDELLPRLTDSAAPSSGESAVPPAGESTSTSAP